jgi:hypothetical protein
VQMTVGQQRPAEITLYGSGLDRLQSAQIIDARGQPAGDLAAALAGGSDPGARRVSLSAGRSAATGRDFRLRLVTRERSLDLPAQVFQLSVAAAYSGSPPPGHPPLTGTSLTCVQCHEQLTGPAKMFAWQSRVVAIADVNFFKINEGAQGATLRQIVQGERPARPNDTLTCTYCHNPQYIQNANATNANPRPTVNLVNTTRLLFCELEQAFRDKTTKPNELRLFFKDWKERGCPD